MFGEEGNAFGRFVLLLGLIPVQCVLLGKSGCEHTFACQPEQVP